MPFVSTGPTKMQAASKAEFQIAREQIEKTQNNFSVDHSMKAALIEK